MVVALVVELECPLPVTVDSPIENVVVAPPEFPFAVVDAVAFAEDPVPVWVADTVVP